MTNEEIKRIKVARVKCDSNLLFFTRYFFKQLKNQKFIVNWHHDVICKELEKVSRYETEFLNINICPRASKTEFIVNFIAQNLGKNPHGNYLYITASDDLRSETSIKIRDIITHEHYKMMYGVEMKKDQNAKNLWRTKEGGGLKTATIFGQITGFGAGQMIEHDELIDYIRDFEGCIILDDINKISDAEALNANNDKTNNTIFNTVLSRKNSADTPLINIQQRAGVDDATAQLEEFYRDNPKFVNLVIPIMNEKGESFWEWKYPPELIQSLKTSPKTAHIFETQYMQNPLPKEGLMFPELQFYNYNDFNDADGVNLSYHDTADEGDDNYSAPFGRWIGDKFWIRDVIFNKHNLDTNLPSVFAKVEQNNTDYLYIETNKDGMLIVREVRRNNKTGCTVRGVNNFANKLVRIHAQSAFIMQHFMFPYEIPNNPEYSEFIKQVKRFQKTSKKDDDAPDSLAGLSKKIRQHFLE